MCIMRNAQLSRQVLSAIVYDNYVNNGIIQLQNPSLVTIGVVRPHHQAEQSLLGVR